jgi:hypothetical protein
MPGALSITVYELPENSWTEIKTSVLPGNWQQVPMPEETKLFGTDLLLKKNVLAIKLPSVIIPTEFNYILNPSATNFTAVKIVTVHSFTLDNRIKK